jgi:hypothetical protein
MSATLDPAKARFSEDILLVDYLVCRNERSLEEQLQEYPECMESECIRAALRKIDDWQKTGCYQEKLEAHRALITEATSSVKVPAFSMPIPPPRHVVATERLMEGLKSPSREQRQRFEALFETIKDRHPSEPNILAILEVLEPVKKTSGRPKGATQVDDFEALMNIKMAVWKDESVAAAAKEAAQSAQGGGTVESITDRLEKGYRKKMALREGSGKN